MTALAAQQTSNSTRKTSISSIQETFFIRFCGFEEFNHVEPFSVSFFIVLGDVSSIYRESSAMRLPHMWHAQYNQHTTASRGAQASRIVLSGLCGSPTSQNAPSTSKACPSTSCTEDPHIRNDTEQSQSRNWGNCLTSSLAKLYFTRCRAWSVMRRIRV